MAPAASIHSSATATAAAAGGASKRPADSDAELLPLDSSALHQQGDEAASKGQLQPQQPKQQLECPRCRSTNTKFCYYNNYSTAQPRHFCRACRRYWTHGGTLRDVPVGGASRRSASGGKRRRVSAEPSPPSAASSPLPTPMPMPMPAAAASLADACLPLPDLTSAAFPFLSDGSFVFPHFDLGAGVALAPSSSSAFSSSSSWQSSSVVPDFFDGLAPWDEYDGATAAAGGFAGAWGNITDGLDLSWTPPGN